MGLVFVYVYEIILLTLIIQKLFYIGNRLIKVILVDGLCKVEINIVSNGRLGIGKVGISGKDDALTCKSCFSGLRKVFQKPCPAL